MKEFFDFLDTLDPTGVIALVLAAIVIIVLIMLINAGDHLRNRPPAPNGEDFIEIPKPKPGDRRWSNFFDSYIEMVHYSSDSLYWFRVLSGKHRDRTYKSQTRWSMLARYSPGHQAIQRSHRAPPKIEDNRL